jgi:thioredoxin reductase (NADPH)
MSKPTILTVDGDHPRPGQPVRRGPPHHWRGGGPEALAVLTKLAPRDEPVALIAADQRMPQRTGIEMLETSVPGVFAASYVRRDSMKRVASAVGEGAIPVYLVDRYLATV